MKNDKNRKSAWINESIFCVKESKAKTETTIFIRYYLRAWMCSYDNISRQTFLYLFSLATIV